MLLLASSYHSHPAIIFHLLQNAEGKGVSLGWRTLVEEMGYIGWGVLLVLMIMSIYSMAVIFERWLMFRATARQSRQFVPRIAASLREARLDDALKLTQEYRKSHLAVVINSGLQELSATGSDPDARRLRRARRALRRAAAIRTAEMQRGLATLATIGSTAPFVGLFGTVFGIIHAFEKMNEQGSPGLANVAGGIAEALYATAFGLLVALPAVWMFNYFTSRVNGFAIEMRNSADELLDYFLGRQERETPG